MYMFLQVSLGKIFFFLEGLQKKKQSLFLLGVKHEVFDILSVIPVNKAVGFDSLSHTIPKSCQETILNPLCKQITILTTRNWHK